MIDLKLIDTLNGHSETVWDIAWDPTGKYLASCGTDKIIKIWGKEGNRWVCKLGLDEGHTRTIRSVAWSPSGKLLASVSFDATTCIWEKSGDTFECLATLEGHENEVKCASFSPSGHYLATCGRDKTIWIWEIDDDNEFECSGVLNSHTQDVKKVSWHPTEDILLSCSYDNTCKIHIEIDGDWETIHSLNDHSSTVWASRFQPKPKPSSIPDNTSLFNPLIASCGDDRCLKLWSSNLSLSQTSDKWKCIKTIKDLHTRPIYDLDWHPVKPVIATAGGDNSITLISLQKTPPLQNTTNLPCVKDTKTFEPSEIRTIKNAHLDDINSLRWNPGYGDILASCGEDSIIKIWQLTDDLGEEISTNNIVSNVSRPTTDHMWIPD